MKTKVGNYENDKDWIDEVNSFEKEKGLLDETKMK